MNDVYIQVFGTRYACIPRYVSLQGLDPLVNFFYEALKEVRRIDVLTDPSVFGLPARVVEDILAELIRRNYARVNMESNELERIENPGAAAKSEDYDGRRILVVQDHLTGGLIPAEQADLYSTPPPGRCEIRNAPVGKQWIEDFMTMPDAQLIAFLGRAQPELVCLQGDPAQPLDRLHSRERLGAQTMYFPIAQVPLQQRTLYYVQAPEIPNWIIRSWNTCCQNLGDIALPRLALELGELEHASVSAYAEASDEESPRPPLPGIRPPSGLATQSFDSAVKHWLTTAEQLLQRVPPPRSIHELRPLRKYQAALQERLLNVAAVSLTATTLTPLDAACDRAKRELLIGLTNLDEGTMRRARKALERSLRDERDVFVLFGVPDSDSPTEKSDLTAFQTILRDLPGSKGIRWVGSSAGSGFFGDFVLVDGETCWLGVPGSLTNPSSMLHIDSANVAISVAAFLLRHIPDATSGEGRMIKTRRFVSAETRQALAEPRPGAKPRALDLLQRQLEAFYQNLVEHALDGEVAESQSLLEQRRLDSGEEDAEPEAVPSLAEQRDAIERSLRMRLPTGCAALDGVEGDDHTALLARTLWSVPSEPQRAIRLLVGPLTRSVLAEPVITMIRRAVSHGHNIDLVCSSTGDREIDAETVEVGLELQNSLDDNRFRVRRLSRSAPSVYALTADDCVCIGTHDWLRALGDQSLAATLSFSCRSSTLAAAVKSLTAAALPIDSQL